MRIKSAKIPKEAVIGNYLPSNYHDVFECSFITKHKITPDDIQVAFWTQSPAWVSRLFKLRNILVKPLGLEVAKSDPKAVEDCIRNSIPHKQFTFIDKTDTETIICLSDKHLDAYMSVYLTENGDQKKLYCTTVVRLHNVLGYLYFYPICPFHYFVVKSMMKFVVKSLKINKKP